MRTLVLCALALVFVATPVASIKLDTSATSSLSIDVQAAKASPVTKVVTLLKDMLKQLEKEAETDEDVYDKMACWCTTNDKEKTESIGAAETRIADLSNKIAELTANSARLSTEIKNAEAEKKENEDALAKATALRQKELAEFNAEEKDMLESLAALKAAITVIGSHHSSLLQMPRNGLADVATTLRHKVQKHASLLAGVFTHTQKRALNAFIQDSDFFDSAPTFKQSYAPQSSQIFGILTQMKETFESNLSASQKEEMAAQKAFEDLKAAKEEQIAGNAAVIDKKTMELATTNEEKAQAEEDLDDTKNSLTADEAFLLSLKKKCAITDDEWEKRQKTRSEEMAAVSKAIAILSTDDAHDLFTKTFNPALLQKTSSLNSQRRTEASQLLSAVAKKLNNPHLAALAVKVRLDAFTKVKAAIDEMIKHLMQEKSDEIKKKDFCVDELDTNERQTQSNEQAKADLITLIEDLELKISTLAKAIEELKAAIGNSQVQLKRAGEDREKQAKEFQMTISDQKETVTLLTKALGILQEFYGKSAAAAFAQKQEPAGPPPPPGFKEYKKNAGAAGVTGMIQQIIDDANAMTAEAIKDEGEAVTAYAALVKDTNDSINAMSQEIVDKSETKAIAEGDLAEAKKDKADTVATLEELAAKNKELHDECDYVMENFDLRQTARDQEVEALKQAKAILSGAKFEVFLQR
mmetsp:Transcript_21750/g.39997  ORF Transcript_21750/g.39997 Transcript_21750/m.39997 type:complete len:696 (+) Transcript_21750:84-2171(+)